MSYFIESDFHSHFIRKNNVVSEVLKNGSVKDVFLFKQNFPDSDFLNKTTLVYLSKYMAMFPDLFEEIKNNTKQLKLF